MSRGPGEHVATARGNKDGILEGRPCMVIAIPVQVKALHPGATIQVGPTEARGATTEVQLVTSVTVTPLCHPSRGFSLPLKKWPMYYASNTAAISWAG